MKKILSLLIVLIAFCELKAQNKQHEFVVEKPDDGVNIIIDEYILIKFINELKFTTKHKNKKYRFTFTHGTIEQKEQILLVHPDKTGEGTIKVYELIEKKYKLVKEVTVDIFEKPLYCFGEKCFLFVDATNDISMLTQPLTIKYVNDAKELVFTIHNFKFTWVIFGKGVVNEQIISGNSIDKNLLSSINKDDNNFILLEDVDFKDEKGNLKRALPLMLAFSKQKPEPKQPN